jgi:hypothetical protein
VAFILENNFLSDVEKIDIFIDYENNAIKILEGNTYKITLIRRGLRGIYKAFGTVAIVKSGVKVGHYLYIGNNTFILE